MNTKDAETMLDVLKKTNKDKTGANLLSENAPSPNEIWATIVAMSDKLDTLQQKVESKGDGGLYR